MSQETADTYSPVQTNDECSIIWKSTKRTNNICFLAYRTTQSNELIKIKPLLDRVKISVELSCLTA